MSIESTSRNVVQMRIDPVDRGLIDRAAELAGMNRSQFILAAARREAKSQILDQSEIWVDAQAFQKIADWLESDEAPSQDLLNLIRSPRMWD